MNAVGELHRIVSGAKSGFIGHHKVHLFEVRTPAQRIVNLFDISKSPYVLLRVRKAYSEVVAAGVLDLVENFDFTRLSDREVTVVERQVGQFAAVALVPPSIAQCFGHRSKSLQENTWWAIPIHRGELLGGEQLREFERAIDPDGQALPMMDWDRQSHPQLQLVLWNARGGFLVGRSATRPARVSRARLDDWLARLPCDADNYALLTNAWGGALKLRRNGEGWQVHAGGNWVDTDHDGVRSAIDRHLCGGQLPSEA